MNSKELSKKYLAKAEEADRLARKFRDRSLREIWFNHAKAYRELAESYLARSAAPSASAS
jgi:hypothetical protein